MDWLVMGAIAALCLYMAWTIGANDVANSMGTAVGSGCITIRQALLIAAVCELAGAVLVGSDVTDTVRKGIVEPEALAGMPEVLCLGMACAVLGSALWLHVASWLGMPVSTSHSIVGAVAGFGVVAAGWGSVYWGTMGEIVLSWFISPIAGLILGYLLFRFIRRTVLGKEQPAAAAVRMAPVIVFLVALIVVLATLYDGLKNLIAQKRMFLTGERAVLIAVGVSLVAALVARLCMARYTRGSHELSLAEQLRKVERIFVPLVIISSCSVSFAHGANDVANAVGPLAAVVDVLRTGTVNMSVHVPLWILALGGVGIVLGLATYGYAVMRVVGKEITEITPSRAIAANIATAATVLACTRLQLPVSTSHTVVGAVLGVGLARGLSAVNRAVTRNIFGAWLVTVPAAAGLTIVLFLLGRLVQADALIRSVMHTAAAGAP
jgi:PiT family inorganic phosphate transporter